MPYARPFRSPGPEGLSLLANPADDQKMEKDRRREARTYVPRPVYVRLVEPDGKVFEEVRTMGDFSRDGLYFCDPNNPATPREWNCT